MCLRHDTFAALLGEHLARFDRVEVGTYGKARVREDVTAFGPDSANAWFLVRDRDAPDIAGALWLELYSLGAEHVPAFQSTFAALVGVQDLILVDQHWNRMLALRDTAGVTAYLEEHATRARRWRRS